MENVIFDLGGVLIDWNVDEIVARAFPDSRERAAVRSAVFDHPDWIALDRGTLAEEEAVLRFARRAGQPVAAMERLMRIVRDSLVPKPESLMLMEELHDRGVPLYCLSNMHASNIAHLWEIYSFWNRFRGIVISAHVKMVKPEPEIFQYLLTTFDLDPARSIFIDDHPDNVQAARGVGLYAILFVSAADCRRQLDTLSCDLLGKRT